MMQCKRIRTLTTVHLRSCSFLLHPVKFLWIHKTCVYNLYWHNKRYLGRRLLETGCPLDMKRGMVKCFRREVAEVLGFSHQLWSILELFCPFVSRPRAVSSLMGSFQLEMFLVVKAWGTEWVLWIRAWEKVVMGLRLEWKGAILASRHEGLTINLVRMKDFKKQIC